MNLWGWHIAVFADELERPLAAVESGGKRRLLVTEPDGSVRAYAGDCPHRGANLALGARDGDAVICAFHGYRIGLGEGPGPFCVDSVPLARCGDLILLRDTGDPDLGCTARLAQLEAENWIIPAFVLTIDAPASLVVENAFDSEHFQPVHRVANRPSVSASRVAGGPLVGRSELHLPASPWQRGSGVAVAPLVAEAYSPGLVITAIGGRFPYTVLTSAAAQGGRTMVRLAFAFPRAAMPAPDPELCSYMAKQARQGIEDDARIWESLGRNAVERLTDRDAAVLAFRAFRDRRGE